MSDATCEHPYWTEASDGHTRSGWECTTCGHWQWIAPWVLSPAAKHVTAETETEESK